MQVVLIILKVLGITVLVLLGLVLLLVLMLLVAPFRYRIDADYYEDIHGTARIRWLWFVLDLKGVYEEQKFLYYLKSFGFTVSTNDENDKHYHPLPEEKDKDDYLAVPTTLLPDLDEELEAYEQGKDKPSEVVKPSEAVTKPQTLETDTQETAVQSQILEETLSEEVIPEEKEDLLPEAQGQAELFFEEQEEPGWNYTISTKFQQFMDWLSQIPERVHHGLESFFTKSHELLSGAFIKVREFFENLNEKLAAFPEKLHEKIGEITYKILDFLANIKENIKEMSKKKDIVMKKLRMIRKFLEKESTKKTWKNLKNFLIKVIKHVKPRKYRGKIRFGSNDPATTGQMLGGISMLMPLYRGNLVVVPDFEQSVFEGEIYMKGRIVIGALAWYAIRYLLNKDMFRTIKCVRRILGK